MLTPQRLAPLHSCAPLLSIIVLISGYCVSFAPLYTYTGYSVGGLVVLPVLLAAQWYGSTIGLLAGMLAFVLNALLFTSVGEAGWLMMSREGAPGIAVVITLGVAIGQMHDRAILSSTQLAHARAECIQLTAQLSAQERRNAGLETALAPFKMLPDIIVICASCKHVREANIWKTIESYLGKQIGLNFSHGLCQACVQKLYPDEVCE